MEQVLTQTAEATPSGLRANILTPMETLAQSISTIAPTTTPTMTIPLVFALAGNGTWLSYLIATGAIILMALTISRFARHSACSGSLYTYVTTSLPPVFSAITAWALLLAYIAIGASTAGGFINYANVFLVYFFGTPSSTLLLAILCCGIATAIAYRNVQVSARLMLWLEAASVSLIVVVLALLLWKNGLHYDHAQLHLQGVSSSGVRLGVIMALFSFVGFESATTLGAEATNPLRTIPRAVIQSALFTGLFFILCAYLETLGMATANQDLGSSDAPLRVLASLAGVDVLGSLIDFGALVSMFACTLACITAASRVLLRMSQNGITHKRLGTTHPTTSTPPPRRPPHRPLHPPPRRHPLRPRSQRHRHLRLDGLTRRLRLYHRLRPRRRRPPLLPPAQPPPHHRHPVTLDRRHHRDDPRPRRNPLPHPTQPLQLAPLRLPRLPALRHRLVLPHHPIRHPIFAAALLRIKHASRAPSVTALPHPSPTLPQYPHSKPPASPR